MAPWVKAPADMPEFDPWDRHGRRQLTPYTCPDTQVPRDMHMYTHKLLKTILKFQKVEDKLNWQQNPTFFFASDAL